MPTKPLTVVETQVFVRQADAIWSEDERLAMVDFVARNPDSGVLIPGTGGVRKMRWSRAGSGKRGGARVVYFYYAAEAPLYLLLAYAKGEREDMTPEQKRVVTSLTTALKEHHAPRGARS